MRAPAFWWLPRPGALARLLQPLGWIYGAVTRARMRRPGVDFNGDRQTDFAVALVDSKKAKETGFALVIFNGGKSGFRQAHFQTDLDLRRSGLFFFSENSERLAVGEFQTDDCGFFRWKNGKYVAEDCTSGEN